MATINLPLVFHISGKAPYQRNATNARVVEMATVRVQEVDDIDAPVAIALSTEPNGNKENLELFRFYENRYWIKDQGNGEASRIIREQSGIISDIKLIKHLGDRSLFLLTQYGSSLPDQIPYRYRSPEIDEFKKVEGDTRDVELAKLEAAAHNNLLLVNNELYFEVGVPFFRLRFTDQPLVISVAFNQVKMARTKSTSEQRFKTIDIELDRISDVQFLSEEWEMETGQKADWRAYPILMGFGDFEPTGSDKTDIMTVANTILQSGVDRMSLWPREHILSWIDLRDARQSAEKSNVDDKIDKMADALLEYGKFIDMDSYTKTVIKRWQMRDIEIPQFHD